ncbi:MATE efflux family protein [Ferroglobus placidus DSM 10642]|uniref:MATE efflux family protein n=1 Tax=Ferroglobus placidus (strain DSM 10642 / AEDII12DO) TaxID=589924 RepID=D3RZX3_FERPA|nr:MATE family efflux transporter [Ferroglobus placidus]ADC66036.1 MATE efflux family protein [Ferroglobus placidus DSM 10642]
MKGVKILLGDPKKALIKLSIPAMISNLVFTLYNLADGVWVAGLGSSALSAVGIFFPIFMIFIALSVGLGIGASSAISRRIGAKDKVGADSTASHALVISLVVAATITSLLIFLETLLRIFGAEGEVLKLALDYSRVVVAGSVFLVFSNVSTGILNGEGSTKRAMYANVSGTLLNIVLDPVFIYVLGLGIVGAAYATVVSMMLTSLIYLHWFLSGKTYVTPTFKHFKFDGKVVFDILRVGIPSSFSMITMSVAMVFLNLIIINYGGPEGIAVFTSAWRIVSFGFIPLFGMAGALTAITGAAFGAKNMENLKKAYYHAIKIAATIELFAFTLIFLTASKSAVLFTYSELSANIYDELVIALRILPSFLPFTPLGIMTVATFQGIGKGEYALAVNILRTLVFQLSFAYVFALSYGFYGVLVGITLGNVVASLVAFFLGNFTIKALERVVV